jgi:hypothetical protein
VSRPPLKVKVVPVRWLPTGAAAMTLDRVILVRRDHLGDEALMTHEMVHVRQWEELGVPRFLWRYLSAYARGRLRGLSHGEAYRAIPLEAEARAVAGR